MNCQVNEMTVEVTTAVQKSGSLCTSSTQFSHFLLQNDGKWTLQDGR